MEHVGTGEKLREKEPLALFSFIKSILGLNVFETKWS